MTRPAEAGAIEERKAEVLSRRERKPNIYVPVPVSDDPADKIEFYIHYVRGAFPTSLTLTKLPY